MSLKCCLRSFSNPTLNHILNGCSMALKQGRYAWRHDSILQRLVEDLNPLTPGIGEISLPHRRAIFSKLKNEDKDLFSYRNCKK